MFCKAACATLLILASPNAMGADFTGAYYCSTQVAAGLSITGGQWQGMGFKPEGAFVLRVKKLASIQTKTS
jgi:hypothetical protein